MHKLPVFLSKGEIMSPRSNFFTLLTFHEDGREAEAVGSEIDLLVNLLRRIITIELIELVSNLVSAQTCVLKEERRDFANCDKDNVSSVRKSNLEGTKTFLQF